MLFYADTTDQPMDPRFFLSTVLLVVLLLGSLFAAVPEERATSPQPRTEATSSPASGVAVVELFTSEGCSSCPPADRLLKTLVGEARSADQPVYALSFHVDYWNDLGWEDPYSDPAYSDRQRTYAQTLGTRVYTPQIIVDGTEVLVGSRKERVRSAIQAALADPAPVTPEVQLRSDADSPSVRVAVPEETDNAIVRVALVERGLSQSVTRGENAGRKLRHANVVRSFETVSAEETQVVTLDAPSDLDPSKASVMTYVQDRQSMEVLGAARVELRNSSS